MVNEFSKHRASKLVVDSPRVRSEDSFAESCFRLVCHLLTERGLDMQTHMVSFPESIAGLLGTDEEKSACLQHWEKAWGAYCGARHSGVASLKIVLDRSPFSTRFMQAASRIAKAMCLAMEPSLSRNQRVVVQRIRTDAHHRASQPEDQGH